eukprot:3291089-Rhodomonas_salina.1
MPVLRVGDTALYRNQESEEMHEVKIVSVDHALEPPTYVIRFDAREQETERGRLVCRRRPNDNNLEAAGEVNAEETPVLRVGDKALYRNQESEEMHEGEIVSVDHTLEPPSYVIRFDAREKKTERGRLTLVSRARANSRS